MESAGGRRYGGDRRDARPPPGTWRDTAPGARRRGATRPSDARAASCTARRATVLFPETDPASWLRALSFVEAEAAIGVTQTDQRRTQSEEREDAQQALQAGHVDQKDFGDHDADQRHAGVPECCRTTQETHGQQGDAKEQPDDRVGVELQACSAEPGAL